MVCWITLHLKQFRIFSVIRCSSWITFCAASRQKEQVLSRIRLSGILLTINISTHCISRALSTFTPLSWLTSWLASICCLRLINCCQHLQRLGVMYSLHFNYNKNTPHINNKTTTVINPILSYSTYRIQFFTNIYNADRLLVTENFTTRCHKIDIPRCSTFDNSWGLILSPVPSSSGTSSSASVI